MTTAQELLQAGTTAVVNHLKHKHDEQTDQDDTDEPPKQEAPPVPLPHVPQTTWSRVLIRLFDAPVSTDKQSSSEHWTELLPASFRTSKWWPMSKVWFVEARRNYLDVKGSPGTMTDYDLYQVLFNWKPQDVKAHIRSPKYQYLLQALRVLGAVVYAHNSKTAFAVPFDGHIHMWNKAAFPTGNLLVLLGLMSVRAKMPVESGFKYLYMLWSMRVPESDRVYLDLTTNEGFEALVHGLY